MRKTLIAAVALAPLYLAAGGAQASTTISSSRTSPVSTSTINSGAPDDITISSGVTVSSTTAGTDAAPAAVVTIDSNNSVTNSGTISTSNINNAVGLLVKGGFTGSVGNVGAISLSSTYTAPTTADGYAQGPFAGTAASGVTGGTGNYGLYGIRVTGASAFNGSISNSAAGSISIKGNDSYGISLETGITGTLTNGGTITMSGDRSVGLRSLANTQIGGDLVVSGAINATGTDSSAVVLNGNVGGAIRLYSSIGATGYAITQRVTDATLLAKLLTPANNQVNQSGSAFVIGGNVAGGIYLAGAPGGTVSGSTADTTGDGSADAVEGTGSINAYGSAPALVIGSAGKAITVGGFSGQGGATQDNGYGMIVRGSISATGVYDNKDATAVQIGTLTPGSVNMSSGVRVYGSISATAYNANATAMHLYSGVSSPNIDIRGTVTSQIVSSTAGVTGYGLLLESGSTVNNLTVTGGLIAAVTGDAASAYAVKDLSGTLNNVLNEGVINATASVTALGDTQTGHAYALDLSHNTTGVTLLQQTNPNPGHLYGDTSGSSHTATTTATALTPTITGDVLLGSGTNTVNILAGSLTGALNMGSGTGGLLNIANGSSVTGAFSFSGTGLAISVPQGVLDNRSASTLHISTLSAGSSSTLSFAADPANNKATSYLATGAVTIGNGAKFGVTLLSTPTTNQTFTLIQSPNLTVGTPDTTLLSTAPFLIAASIKTNPAAGTVTLDIRRRTATEMGLNASEAAALDPVFTASAKDKEVQAVLLAQTSQTPFLRVYDQLLPDSSGAVFEAARQASDAVSRATAAHDQTPGAAGTRSFWGEEFVIGAHGDRTAQNIDYDIGGFGVVAGAAFGGSGFGAVGVTASFATLNITNPLVKGDSQQALTTLEGGVYWQGTVGHLSLDARLGIAADSIDGRRQLYSIGSAGTVAVNRHVKDNRTGYSYTAHIGAGYEQEIAGGFYLRPQVRFDYFGMEEDGFKENDTVGQGFALNVSSRSGSVGSATASMVLGRTWGTDFRVRPELEVGVRDAFSGDPGVTTAQFVSGGPSFKLTPSTIDGTGGLVRMGLKASTDFYEIGIHAGAEMRDNFFSGDARVTVRLLF